MSTHTTVSPETIKHKLEEENAVLIDVREPRESAAERIACAALIPLSSFSAAALPTTPGRPVYLHCKSGGRSGQAMKQCAEAGIEVAGHMEGGIEAWKAAGLPVERASAETGLTVSQAVTVTASLIVLATMAVSLMIGPLALLPGAIVSVMMLQAAFTGFCPAGRIFLGLGLRPG
jgi:rhodanese-related sulfurtransferase